MKRIALLLLVVASACKTENAAPQPAADPAPTPVARRAAPPMPKLAEEAPLGSDTPPDEGRHHGDHMNPDTDGDGKISDEEREAARKQRTEKMRARLDTNNDGKLTPDELANAKGRMKFDDPAALDTNHDGDISADELEAGMKARRDEMRQQRLQGRDPTGMFPPSNRAAPAQAPAAAPTGQ